MKVMAPGVKKCYLWLDFGCMDQDGNPAGELKQLDEIVRKRRKASFASSKLLLACRDWN